MRRSREKNIHINQPAALYTILFLSPSLQYQLDPEGSVFCLSPLLPFSGRLSYIRTVTTSQEVVSQFGNREREDPYGLNPQKQKHSYFINQLFLSLLIFPAHLACNGTVVRQAIFLKTIRKQQKYQCLPQNIPMG